MEFDSKDIVLGIVFGIIAILWLVAIATHLLINFITKLRKKGKQMEKIYWNEAEGQIMTKGGECLYDREGVTKVVEEVRNAVSTHYGEPFEWSGLLRDKMLRFEKAIQGIQNNTPPKLKHLQSQISHLQSMLDRRTTEIKRLTDKYDDLMAVLDSLGNIDTKLECAAKGHKMAFSRIADFHIKRTRIAGFLDETDIDTTDLFVFKCSNCGLEITKTEKELTPMEVGGLKQLKLL